MGRNTDETGRSSDPAQLEELAALLRRMESEPVPPRIRELTQRLQAALQDALANRSSDRSSD